MQTFNLACHILKSFAIISCRTLAVCKQIESDCVMMVLFLKLLCAHILGDFIFQPYKWVACKESKKHKSPYLYWHVAVHAVATMIVLGFDPSYWLGFSIIVSSHLLIDIWKIQLKSNAKSILPFFLDQLAHISVITAVVHYYTPIKFNFNALITPQILLFILCILFITNVSAIVMKVFIAKLNIPKIQVIESSDKAGTLVGIIERLFVFTFIIINFWIGIGFLIIAKSLFKFADINKAKDHRITEYFLLGTLLSFGLAIIIGVGYTYCLKILV